MKIWIGIGLALALGGCTLLKPQSGDVTARHLAETWRETGGTAPTVGPWWLQFNEPELDRYIEEALAGNLSVAQYAARLRQQQALADKAGASRLPSLSGSASAARSWPDLERGDRTDAFKLGLSASYELDLWGRIHAGASAAARGRDASLLDLESAMLSLAANVTDTWLSAVAQQAQLDLLRHQLATNTQQLDLLALRQRNGQASTLDTLQQAQATEAVRALIPAAELRIGLLESQLAVLLGRPAGARVAIQTRSLPQLPPLPTIGLPSDLLTQRPDVRAHLLRLEAREWSVAAARAARLPTITLSGSVGATDARIADVLDRWAANLMAGLVAPLIDGGRLRAEVAFQQAQLEETVAACRATLLTAATEVENALLTHRKTLEQQQLKQRQLELLSDQLDEATRRYRNGLTDYLAILNALNAHQALERGVIETALTTCQARVALHRALGGDWMRAPAHSLSNQGTHHE